MTILENARYRVDMGCGVDYWKLCGEVFGHPNFEDGSFVYTSTPIEFNEIVCVLRTASGRVYKIASFGDAKEKVVGNIKEDIANGGSRCI